MNDVEMVEKNNNKLNDVIILRAFATIAVVIFHSYLIYITRSDMYLANTPYRGIYQQIFYNLFSFRMPLFVFVSGYLFAHLYSNKGKYKHFFPFIKHKAKRLLLPYAIFTVLMGVSLWDTSHELTLRSFLGGYSHLWFILMSYSCFVVGRIWFFLYEKFPNKYFLIVSIFISALISYHPIGCRFLWPFAICRAERFFFWFFLGMIVLMRKDLLMAYLNRKVVLITLFAVYIGSCLYVGKYCDVPVYNSFAMISFFCAIFLLYYGVNELHNKKMVKVSTFLENFNKCSYGIYVFHYWIILLIYQHKNIFQQKLIDIATVHYILYPAIASLFCLVLSYLITYYVLKTKWGRFLVG